MIFTILLIIPLIFIVIGVIGFFRFPDFYTRTHSSTIVTVGGVCLALFILLLSRFWSVYSSKTLLIIIFILITSPTASHAIANVAYKTGVKPKKIEKNDWRREK